MVFQCVLKDSNVPYRLIKGPYLQRLLNSLPEQPFAPNIFLSVLAKRDGQELFEIPIGHKERKNRYRFDYEMEATQSVLAFDDGIAPF
jgi:dolichol-phosphate mannosyltransferase